MSLDNVEPGSFRDRNGRVIYQNDDVYRVLSERAFSNWRALKETRFFQKENQSGRVVATEESAEVQSKDWAGTLKHERIPFISYPYEWSFSMLKDAALLHLELLQDALAEDFILKDSSAYNVQFRGSQAVFIDIPSFEPLAPGAPWVGYNQFCHLFLYPLMLAGYKDVSYHSLLRGSIDGIDAEFVNNLMTKRDLLRSGVLLHVYLQARLQSSYADTKREIKTDLQSAGFHKALIENNVKKLKKLIDKLHWREKQSEWSHYAESHSYTEEGQAQKEDFIRAATKDVAGRMAWDIGCNTGHYARILAEHTDHVVAMDFDHLAIERLYLALKSEGNKKILPLVMNLADASPNLGWRGEERKSIVGRGKPELVIALALIHHMVIGANIPLFEFVAWLRELGSAIVIEFVSKEDEMVKKLLQNKDDIYDDYSQENFEDCIGQMYTIERKQEVKNGVRWLYFIKPK